MNHDKRAGFTLIELTLAMAFIAMLLLAISLTVLQISQTYNRGLTLKEVDQASRAITSDISQDLSNAAAFSLNVSAHRYVAQAWGGSLCLGQYSYIWNFGSAVDTYNKGGNGSINLVNDSGTKTAFNLLRVLDPSANLCANTGAKTVLASDAVELLKNTDHNVAVHEFCIATQASAADTLTGQQLYTVNYSVGTNDVNALTASTQPICTGTNVSDGLTTCKAPGIAGANLDYCTNQEFSLVARAQYAVN